MEYTAIRQRVKDILAELKGTGTELIAVTKTRSVEEINAAIEAGVRHIGENRVQELLEKYDRLHLENVQVHLIGRLQTNKVKYVIGKVDLIHSVDSVRLAEEISRRALSAGTVQRVLIEINIGGEASKGGVAPEELEGLLIEVSKLTGIRVCGLMCIPPVAAVPNDNLKYFSKMKELSVDIMKKKIDNVIMDVLSMGMSDDYRDAIKAGSSFVRIGRGIFGPRI